MPKAWGIHFGENLEQTQVKFNWQTDSGSFSILDPHIKKFGAFNTHKIRGLNHVASIFLLFGNSACDFAAGLQLKNKIPGRQKSLPKPSLD